jgi:thiamine-monophosphate kinase
LISADVTDTKAIEAVLTAHRMPQPPYQAGPAAAAAGATALIDTSDGLLRDAVRIAVASAVVIDLELDALPRSTHLERVAALLGAGSGTPGSGTTGDELVREWLLTGGEDHALLACLPPGSLPAGFVPIGTVREMADGESPGVRLDGRTVSGRLGWTNW